MQYLQFLRQMSLEVILQEYNTLLNGRNSFPYDGEYKFNAMADNISQVYIDNELVLETKRFKGGPDKFKNVCP